jgi:hypothetical protein
MESLPTLGGILNDSSKSWVQCSVFLRRLKKAFFGPALQSCSTRSEMLPDPVGILYH